MPYAWAVNEFVYSIQFALINQIVKRGELFFFSIRCFVVQSHLTAAVIVIASKSLHAN